MDPIADPAAGPADAKACGFMETHAAERPDVLVIASDLLLAESVVLALSQALPTLVVRFVYPVTIAHIRDLTLSPPRVALLDIDSGEEATCLSAVSLMRDAGVLVAVMGGKRDLLLLGDCLNAGASSVIDKESPLASLIAAIMRLLGGDTDVRKDARRVLNGLIMKTTDAWNAQLAPFRVLTQREKIVLAELMQGHAPEVIAARSCVAISTVRSQVRSILQKLGVNSQLAAVGMAQRAGWSLNGTSPHGRTSVRPSSASRGDTGLTEEPALGSAVTSSLPSRVPGGGSHAGVG